MYFATVSLPLHSSNNFLAWITIGGSYTIVHVVLLTLVAVACIRSLGNGRVNWANAFCVVFVFGHLMALMMGVRAYGLHQALLDFGRYLLAILFLVGARTRRFGKADLQFFLYLSMMAMFVNCCINVVMDVTGWSVWGLQAFFSENRLGGGYFSLVAFFIPYALYCVLNDDECVKLWFFAAFLAVAFVGLLYAKSRTPLLLMTVGCIVALAVNILNVRGRNYGLRLVATIALGWIGIAFVGTFLSSSSDLAQRMLMIGSGSSLMSTSGSLLNRLITWQYYWGRILANPMGYGYGAQMIGFSNSGDMVLDAMSFEVDSALHTVGYHGGLFGMALYVILVGSPFVALIRSRGMGKARKAVLMACYALLLFGVFLMTSQCIHNYPVVAFVWTFIGLTLDMTPFCETADEAPPTDTRREGLRATAQGHRSLEARRI
ncbi:O-antigen ligase family protein [Paratractidigestivibacter sp.]|uniref:O-antigen ligase family protein n=1 Tax=Paratractidigestivibacter sp. TaxID=2847316 RepID=UPI002ACB0A66|nr:O-antigen ligase family protein [Paratractidigestivibacter sp.]